MAEDQSWVPRRRLRHLKQIAVYSIPAIPDDHDVLTLALFSTQPAAPSAHPVLLHTKTTVADLAPVFLGVESAVARTCNHLTGPQFWEESSFRLILVSHRRNYTALRHSRRQSVTAVKNCRQSCHACLHPQSSSQTGRCESGNAISQSNCRQITQLPGACVDWVCQAHHTGRFPIVDLHDRIRDRQCAQDSMDSCCPGIAAPGRAAPDSCFESSSLSQLGGASLATIRESRCLSDKHLPELQLEASITGRPNSDGNQQHHVSVSLKLQPYHVCVRLAVSEPLTHMADKRCAQVATCEKNNHKDQVDVEQQADLKSRPESGGAASTALGCRWQLQPQEGSTANVLIDTVIDLNADAMAVPLHFSRFLSFQALPANCVMLGVQSGCGDLGNDVGEVNGKLIHEQGLLLHPPLDDQAAQQFVEDNRSRKQKWMVDRTAASYGLTGGLVDAIVNTLFPFPLPPIRHQQPRPLPRTVSSPSVRDVAMGVPSSAPRSPRITRSVTHHARHRSFDSAPGLQPSSRSVGQHDAGLTGMSTVAFAPSHRRSTTLSTSSASTAGSDTRSTVVSHKHSSAQGVAGQHSMPAMQYIAFAVREVAELVSLQRRAAAGAAVLKKRLTRAVRTCQAALDLEAQVKQLQVKTQQLRLRNDDLARRTTVARRTAAVCKQRAVEQQERLQDACGPGGPLAACLQRAKEQRLCYPDMLHTWRHTHGLLVTRRHQLIISLFHHFKLQPQAVVRYAGGVLTEMQDLWMHQKLLQDPSRRSSRVWSSTSAVPGHRRCGSSSSIASVGLAASHGAQATDMGSGPQPPTHCEDGLISKLTPVMTIMGLQCAPDAARRAQLGELGWETSSALQLDHMNAVYGYIAQIVVFLGNVLDVPPLYHLELEGSYCRVQQHMPRTLRSAVGEAELYEEEPGHTLRLTEHPLYVDQGKHEAKLKKFAWACFLLGTNVQQLLHEHGIAPHGQQFLLENLEKLVAAARISGLQPGF